MYSAKDFTTTTLLISKMNHVPWNYVWEDKDVYFTKEIYACMQELENLKEMMERD